MSEQILEHTALALTDASIDIWDSKYRLKDVDGIPVDSNIFDTKSRVARTLADLEPKDQEHWYEQYLWALDNGAIPAGRIMSNAGATAYKPNTSTINCTVSPTIPDSMSGIMNSCHDAAMTLKAGCGIGYEFSTLRPNKYFVSGAGADTSGPLSFMDIYDKMCFTIRSAGNRRGAQMATFDISHPDGKAFIRAKREDGRLRQFNLSLLITNDFVHAVKEGRDWPLFFPVTEREKKRLTERGVLSADNTLYKVMPHLTMLEVEDESDAYATNNKGEVLCLITDTVKAERLWNVIMTSTFDYAEPGFILIDRVNKMNNNWFCEYIRATNPCGEQPLPPDGSCLLGSINIAHFVLNPFTSKASFDWDKYKKVIAIFTRMLDSVVEINGLALEGQRREINYKRRHGMGITGQGSACVMQRIKYGSKQSCKFTDDIMREMALVGMRTGVELAKEKGCAPIFNDKFLITAELMTRRPELDKEFSVGDKVSAKVLLGKYSHYMQTLGEVDPKLIKDVLKHGIRFTHHSSIAPTGTISLSFGNNVSNGIEPSFAHSYNRNIIRTGKKSKEKVEVMSYELLAYRALINKDADPFATEGPNKLPAYFVDSNSVPPEQHVDVQAAAQKWVDSSISKTINVPTDIDFEEFKTIYLYAYEKGLKGCTTFRFNPKAFQGVLVTEADLENTTYTFNLEDGSSKTFKGNDMIMYDGEAHSAANLYDALKEGYYGKF